MLVGPNSGVGEGPPVEVIGGSVGDAVGVDVGVDAGVAVCDRVGANVGGVGGGGGKTMTVWVMLVPVATTTPTFPTRNPPSTH